MEMKKTHWVGIALGAIVITASLFFMETNIFFFLG
jgi:general stress protein CsbA